MNAAEPRGQLNRQTVIAGENRVLMLREHFEKESAHCYKVGRVVKWARIRELKL